MKKKVSYEELIRANGALRHLNRIFFEDLDVTLKVVDIVAAYDKLMSRLEAAQKKVQDANPIPQKPEPADGAELTEEEFAAWQAHFTEAQEQRQAKTQDLLKKEVTFSVDAILSTDELKAAYERDQNERVPASFNAGEVRSLRIIGLLG